MQFKNINIQQSTYNTFNNYKGNKYIPYGIDDRYGDELVGLLNSPTHTACIDLKVRSLNNQIPFLNEDLQKIFVGNGRDAGLLHKIIQDKVIFNGFAVKVKRSMVGDNIVLTLSHVPFNKLRLVEKDGYVDSIMLISNNGKKNKIYPFFEVGDEDITESIYYHKGYTVKPTNYPDPTYSSAFNSINSEIEIGRHILANILNGFNPSAIIHIPNKPIDDESKYEIEKQVQDFGKGAVNGTNIMVVYGDGENRIEILPYQGNNSVDMYNNVEVIIKQNILTAHGLTSPTLAGIPGDGGLGGNGSEITQAFNLFRKTVLEPIKTDIETNINQILEIIGEKLRIEITDPLI